LEKKDENKPPEAEKRIRVSAGGPYLLSGGIPLAEQHLVPDAEGLSIEWRKGREFPPKEKCALCRCGRSGNKPYCDGTHAKIDFDGTETASREPYVSRIDEKVVGPELELTDVVALCASARFCYRAGGAWENTRQSANPEARKIALQEACDCPAGRLVAWDKQGNPIEPAFEPSVGVVVDPQSGGMGPLWVRGGIPVESAAGERYEIRNRVTLCRCGRSANKPFCDGKHAEKK
jgi:CDGSH-type Zn-finger protein